MKWLKRVEAVTEQEAEEVLVVPESVLTTFNLQIISPKPPEVAPTWDEAEKRVLADLPAMIEVIEEELTRLLPEGFRAQMTEWDQ